MILPSNSMWIPPRTGIRDEWTAMGISKKWGWLNGSAVFVQVRFMLHCWCKIWRWSWKQSTKSTLVIFKKTRAFKLWNSLLGDMIGSGSRWCDHIFLIDEIHCKFFFHDHSLLPGSSTNWNWICFWSTFLTYAVMKTIWKLSMAEILTTFKISTVLNNCPLPLGCCSDRVAWTLYDCTVHDGSWLGLTPLHYLNSISPLSPSFRTHRSVNWSRTLRKSPSRRRGKGCQEWRVLGGKSLSTSHDQKVEGNLIRSSGPCIWCETHMVASLLH